MSKRVIAELKAQLAEARAEANMWENRCALEASVLRDVLDELTEFKAGLDGAMMLGMGSEQIINQLEKQLSHCGLGGVK